MRIPLRVCTKVITPHYYMYMYVCIGGWLLYMYNAMVYIREGKNLVLIENASACMCVYI